MLDGVSSAFEGLAADMPNPGAHSHSSPVWTVFPMHVAAVMESAAWAGESASCDARVPSAALESTLKMDNVKPN